MGNSKKSEITLFMPRTSQITCKQLGLGLHRGLPSQINTPAIDLLSHTFPSFSQPRTHIWQTQSFCLLVLRVLVFWKEQYSPGHLLKMQIHQIQAEKCREAGPWYSVFLMVLILLTCQPHWDKQSHSWYNSKMGIEDCQSKLEEWRGLPFLLNAPFHTVDSKSKSSPRWGKN